MNHSTHEQRNNSNTQKSLPVRLLHLIKRAPVLVLSFLSMMLVLGLLFKGS